MTNQEYSTARELSAIELDQVSGGECTCGSGANCLQFVGTTSPFVLLGSGWINCSGIPVNPLLN